MSLFTTFSDRLLDLSIERPNVPAVIAIDRNGDKHTTSYGDLQRLVEGYASNLHRRGVDGQATVVVLLPNDVRNIVVAAAAWKLGAFVVPLNPTAPETELAAQLALIATRGGKVVTVGQEDASQSLSPEVTDVEALESQSVRGVASSVHRAPSRAICSGGTTGRPKLIVDETPWGWSGSEPILDEIGWAKARRILIYSPLYHNVGATLTHRALMAGKSVYLMEKFSPELAVKTIREGSIEFFFAVPTHMQRILGLADITQADFDSVIGMYHSGAQCPPSIKRKWLSLLGAERVWEIYGATDGAGFTVIRGDDWLNHPGSVGRPVGTEILILDDEGEEVPRGVVGSIFMAPLLRPGGGRDPTFSYIGADLPPLIRGRFRTAGDMGWLDKLGYLHIADRRTDMIITGGANVFPAEVEAALIEHPAVDEVAVIGISDPEWGHRVHAVVKPVDPADSDWNRLDEFCRQRLAPYKRPKSYEFVKTLPRTEVGKISRAQLTRERVACDASGCSKRSAAQ